jgi:hypothetical protein
MIVVRNVFRLKFGKTKEAVALFKEGIAIQKKIGVNATYRLLTDLAGPFYTLVLELTLPNLTALEEEMPKVMGNPDFQATYQKIVALVESGYREIFNQVE